MSNRNKNNEQLIGHLSEILIILDEELENAAGSGLKNSDQIFKALKRIDRWKTECFAICESITGHHPLAVMASKNDPGFQEAYERFVELVEFLKRPVPQGLVDAIEKLTTFTGAGK